MVLSDSGVRFICAFEGFSEGPYLDEAGIPTIGFGTTFYPSGKKVTLDDAPITREKALGYVKWFVEKGAIPVIKSLVTVELNQNQVDSLCSFIYNIGANAFKKSTLLKKINLHGACIDIQNEFLRWIRAGGKVLKGLKIRRAKEANLFCNI